MNTKDKEKEDKDKVLIDAYGNEQKEKLFVRVTADKVYKRSILTRLLLIFLTIALLFLAGLYGALYIANETGNFTIVLDKQLKRNKQIYVSNYEDFHEIADVLKTNRLEYMTNITESWLPSDIEDYEGAHNGENYLAYTFFVKNGGEEIAEYETRIVVLSVIKNVDEAVRVALYYNGEKTVYAKPSKSGEPEDGAVSFISNRTVMNNVVEDMQPGEIDKYTVVIWLEGNDPECIDDILGGEMKLEMNIFERGAKL